MKGGRRSSGTPIRKLRVSILVKQRCTYGRTKRGGFGRAGYSSRGTTDKGNDILLWSKPMGSWSRNLGLLAYFLRHSRPEPLLRQGFLYSRSEGVVVPE